MRQKRIILLSGLIRAVILIGALYMPATAGEPIRIYLDGQLIGTLAGLEYHLDQGAIHITTHELVVGCQQAGVFRDRFEGEQ